MSVMDGAGPVAPKAHYKGGRGMDSRNSENWSATDPDKISLRHVYERVG